MSAQLDSSGEVSLIANDGDLKAVIWSDLAPFTQGYVEALFADLSDSPLPALNRAGFSDLAPETLARIMEDCERLQDRLHAGDEADAGATAWRMRQRGDFVGGLFVCPPLAPYLGDDGKVYLREAA